MYRLFFLTLALAGSIAASACIAVSTSPAVEAASVPDPKSCPHAYHPPGGVMAQQTAPKSISKMAGSVLPNDPGTNKLNAGCQPLATPLPPQGSGKTFSP